MEKSQNYFYSAVGKYSDAASVFMNESLNHLHKLFV